MGTRNCIFHLMHGEGDGHGICLQHSAWGLGSEGDRGILPATLCMWKGIEGDREMCMLHYACHLMHEDGKNICLPPDTLGREE